MRNLFELQKLIYGATNTIHTLYSTTDTAEDRIKQINSVRDAFVIEGAILNKSFVETENLQDSTTEEKINILIQYLLTYTFCDHKAAQQFINENLTEEQFESAKKLFESREPDDVKKFILKENYQPLSEKNSIVKYLSDVMSSKAVLRDNQIEMFRVCPIDILALAFEKAEFTINETKMLIISMLADSDYKGQLFKSPDDIVRFIYNVFAFDRANKTATSLVQLNKIVLSKVDLKIPTKYRKKILQSLNEMALHQTAINMKKFLQFWKRIYAQLAYTKEAKMAKRFPRAFELKEKLYGKTIHTDNSDIEYFRQLGDLGTAFAVELNNPGQMIRRLLSYLRYDIGDRYAHKSDGKNNPERPTVVSNIKDLLEDSMFDSALSRCSTKLLWQMLSILENKDTYEEKHYKKFSVCKKQIHYNCPLPAVKKDLADIAIEKIEYVLDTMLKERNSNLQNIYIDKETVFDTIPIQYSGRLDENTSVSGEYLPSGSKISLERLVSNFLKKNKNLKDKDVIFRSGIAWKSTKSMDIDLSTMFVDKYNSVHNCYFGKPLLSTKEGKIIAVSSGDITYCNNSRYSVELLDIDYALAKENINMFYNVTNIYSGTNFKETDMYFFIKVMPKSERINSKTSVYINDLADMDFAVKVNSAGTGYVGVAFENDPVVGPIIHIINKPLKFNYGQSVAGMHKTIIETAYQSGHIYYKKVLNTCFEKTQFVSDISKAEVIITGDKNFDDSLYPKAKVYNIATKAEEMNHLYF